MTALGIGIDVGGTFTKVGVTNTEGTMLSRTEFRIPRSVDELVSRVAAAIRDLDVEEGAVGVVVPGIVDESAGTVTVSRRPAAAASATTLGTWAGCMGAAGLAMDQLARGHA